MDRKVAALGGQVSGSCSILLGSRSLLGLAVLSGPGAGVRIYWCAPIFSHNCGVLWCARGCGWDVCYGVQINSAVLMKVNSASINMLRLAGSYVTYGPPNLKTVRELVYKRGFACVNKQRLPLTDNKIIADNLGKHGITCMEDVIHELYTVGPKFTAVNRFLWP